MPFYHVPGTLNRRIGERLKAGVVRIIFRKLGLKNWTSERILKVRDQRVSYLPTGELEIRGNKKIAVFVESVHKRSVEAYEKLFEDCRKLGYDKVFVIAEWNIPEFILKAKEEFHFVWPLVWFAPYGELITKGAETQFFNQKGRNSMFRDFGLGFHP